MKNVLILLALFICSVNRAQVSVYNCGLTIDDVTQAEIDLVNSYYGTCVLFNSNVNFNFTGSSNKEILASKQIQIKDAFRSGAYNINGSMHMRVLEESPINVVTTNYSSLMNVKKLKKFELGIEPPNELLTRINHFLFDEGTYNDELNPFMDWDVDVEATFTHVSSGSQKIVNGYYHREFIEDQVEDSWIDVGTNYPFRIRFAPPQNGKWLCKIDIKVLGVTQFTSSVFLFNVVESNDLGYVSVHPNNRNLMRDNQMIYPVGQNLPFPYELVNDYSVPAHETHKAAPLSSWEKYLNGVENYFQMGGKYLRIMQRAQSNLIEFEKLGNYYDRLNYAWETDKLMDLCEQYDGLAIFNFLHQSPFMKYGDYYSHRWDWDHYDGDGTYNYNDDFPVYCYNTDPGNKLPYEMFLNDEDLDYHKQRTRYYIARYGYSTKIYDFELLSESWHIGEFWSDGQANNSEGAPFNNINHLEHDLARAAVLNYYKVISQYIKNELNHTNHLVGINIGLEGVQNIDTSYRLNSIDIIGVNRYHDGHNPFMASVTNNFYLDVASLHYEGRKPVLLSEGGTNNVKYDCSNFATHPVDMMTLGFMGFAGFNQWAGGWGTPSYVTPKWQTIVRAEQHMNGFDVINTLSKDGGSWIQGRQSEKRSVFDETHSKETQYYRSMDRENAVGYVRNRTYNTHTKRLSNACLFEFSGDNIPVDNLVNIEWNEGPALRVKSLNFFTDYKVEWYDYNTGNYIDSSCFNSLQDGEIKLKFPHLTVYEPVINRPVLWFVLKEQKCGKRGIDIEEQNERSDSRNLMVLKSDEQLDIDVVLNFPNVYPNPFSDQLIIDSPVEDDVAIMSIDGSVVSVKTVSEGMNRIETYNLSKGIYIIHFQKQNVKLKLIKL